MRSENETVEGTDGESGAIIEGKSGRVAVLWESDGASVAEQGARGEGFETPEMCMPRDDDIGIEPERVMILDELVTMS